MPGIFEHCTSTHRELQCFQMRGKFSFLDLSNPKPNRNEKSLKCSQFYTKIHCLSNVQIRNPKKGLFYSPYPIVTLGTACDPDSLGYGQIFIGKSTRATRTDATRWQICIVLSEKHPLVNGKHFSGICTTTREPALSRQISAHCKQSTVVMDKKNEY